MTRRAVMGVAVWLFATGWCDAAVGQATLELTLEEALRIAGERNPTYLQTKSQVSAAIASARAGLGAFLPRLSAGMSWDANSNTTLTGVDDFGRATTLPEPLTIRQSGANQILTGSLLLFDGLQNVSRFRASRQDVAAAHSAVGVQGLQLEADVSQRFYDALRTQRLIQVEEDLLASSQRRLDANERLFRVAAANQVDVLGAQVDVARQEQSLALQQGDAEKARLAVLESLGILDETLDFTPVGEFPAVFDPASFEAEALVSRALSVNPLVSQRQAEASSAGSMASAARGTWLPTINLSGQLARSLNQPNFGAFFDPDPSQNRGYGLQLSVNWDIFNGFERSQQISQANVQRDIADEAVRLTKLQTEQQVRAAVIDLNNRYRAFRTQERATALSRQRVDLAEQQYAIGSIDFTALQQIIEGASNEERNLVRTEYDFAVSLVTLELRVGERLVPRP